MEEQLELISTPRELRMTDWYRRVGRKGVRNARLALAARTPKPHRHVWRITHTTTGDAEVGKTHPSVHRIPIVALRCRDCPQRATAEVLLYKIPTGMPESRGLVQEVPVGSSEVTV